MMQMAHSSYLRVSKALDTVMGEIRATGLEDVVSDVAEEDTEIGVVTKVGVATRIGVATIVVVATDTDLDLEEQKEAVVAETT